MLFDSDGKINRYESPEHILADFFDLRLDYYERRRVALLEVCMRMGVCVHGCAYICVCVCAGATGVRRWLHARDSCRVCHGRAMARPQHPTGSHGAALPCFFPERPMHPRPRSTSSQDAQWEHRRASNKIRFILAVIKGELVLANRKKAAIEEELEREGYDRMAKKTAQVCMLFGLAVVEFWWDVGHKQ